MLRRKVFLNSTLCLCDFAFIFYPLDLKYYQKLPLGGMVGSWVGSTHDDTAPP